MNELVERLTQKAGITEDQAEKVLEALKEFITEKFPMLENAVDGFLGGNSSGKQEDFM